MVAPAVEAFLRERFGDVTGVERFPRGEWSQAFGFRTADGEDLVVRFGRHRVDFEKDRIAAGFDRPGLPVPAVIEIGEAMGGSYAIAPRVRGRTFDDGAHRPVHLDALPAVLAARETLETVDPPGPGFGAWDGEGVAPFSTWADALLAIGDPTSLPRAHGWRDVLVTVPPVAAIFDEGLARLAEVAGACPNDVRRVVHCDLLAGNVLVDGGQVTGVTDWGNALYGDPRYDLAPMVFWAPWHPGLGEAIEVELDDRILACLLHVGLENCAYNAYLRRLDDLQRTAERLLVFSRAE